MRLAAPAVVAVAAAVTLAACGGGSSSSDDRSSLSVKQVSGVGSVLVDARGMALYTPDQEADGRVRCAAGCTSSWPPVAPVAGTAPGGVGKLGSVRRPDGTSQLTAGGRPLYTFTRDAPGKVSGDGVSDTFGGRRLTWHVVTVAGGEPARTTPSRSAYGY
jgi:predicted lipoprotein with Yx(FWY)xxD motif